MFPPSYGRRLDTIYWISSSIFNKLYLLLRDVMDFSIFIFVRIESLLAYWNLSLGKFRIGKFYFSFFSGYFYFIKGR